MNTNPFASTALQLFEPAEDAVYSIEAVAHLTAVPRHLIAVYCRYGLIAPLASPETSGWWFDDEAVRQLRRLERLRIEYGLTLGALRLVSDLLAEREFLRAEVRFWRNRAL